MSNRELHEDRAFLDAFRRGERDALARVFALYVADVTTTLRAGVAVDVDGQRVRLAAGLPESEIEVMIQDTFLRAFTPSARAAYDGLRPFGAYLATIARNLLIDRGRRLLRETRTMVPLQSADLPEPDAADPAWQVEEAQLKIILDKLKAELPEDQRAVFACRFEQQLSIRETAKALGLTIIVVRRRDTRLRAHVLAVLRTHGYLENARVRIGGSLLARRNDQGATADAAAAAADADADEVEVR